MSDNPITGLPDDVRRLLEAESSPPPPPADAKARVLSRLSQSVSAGLAAGAVMTDTSAAPVPSASTGAAGGTGTSALMSTKALLVGMALTTAAVMTVVTPAEDPQPKVHDPAVATVPAPAAPEPAAAPAAVPSVAPESAPEPTPEPVPVANPEPVELKTPPKTQATPPPTPPLPPTETVEDVAPAGAETHAKPAPVVAAPRQTPAQRRAARLDAERRLLREARRAMLTGDSARALKTLDRMAKRFPRGQHREDRRALRVQALARAGRLNEARRRARAFQQAYPGSIHTESVRQATGENR